MADPRDVPELDLPTGRPSSRTSAAPKTALVETAEVVELGMELERGPQTSMPPSTPRAQDAVAIELGSSGELGMEMEIERGGSIPSQAAMSTPPAPSRRPVASPTIDVAYRRIDPRAVATPSRPTTTARAASWAAPLALAAGVVGALLKFAHHAGGRHLASVAPHAFDATSTVQSGAASGVLVVVSITVGFLGLRAAPRSFGMITASIALMLAALAMVTVTLVSTDEHPGPADGALLMPYLIPLSLFALGVGVLARAPHHYLRGGAGHALAVLGGIAAGVAIFAAFELGPLAAY